MATRSANQKRFRNIGGDRNQTPGEILHQGPYVVITAIIVDI
jgi:hypothetical protein